MSHGRPRRCLPLCRGVIMYVTFLGPGEAHSSNLRIQGSPSLLYVRVLGYRGLHSIGKATSEAV